ncbi:a3292934-c2dc-448a-8899-6121e3d4c8d1 [Thermothielavioides terrestris]|uniref:NmrA-like domain-containing protein n=2 Tax=Thermothielavioides terrestris TaxID=2587410 RepID=G2R9G6_THETT|nr:uncharacterized protein THITE_2052864 [Thermothielavioides terrestris NRRL 8126]AEO68707.1 hypothetical protein THITE_2052864 [Thermothielavioides terrestris NRRL 8126]SPQ23023.1 a3292934-c2dc-448a-8899-6121e3d4c8d1 [Thermothielavioides terrestris]
MAPNKAFVCVATGDQGGTVARQLRALGWEVHTTSRNPTSAAAQALASVGVKVHQGNLDDTAVLESAIAGSDALFLAQQVFRDNPALEFEQGQTILRIAHAAGVRHVIYSSAIPVRHLGPDHFVARALKPKTELENAVRASAFPHWTILQPGSFMANFLSPKADRIYSEATATGHFRVAFRPTTEIPMIDHEDIAAFAVAALQQPARFHAQTIQLASENVTAERIFAAIRRGTGRDIRVTYLTDEEALQALATNPPLALQQILRDAPPFDAVQDTRRWGVPTGTFEAFVERERERFEETYRNVEKY